MRKFQHHKNSTLQRIFQVSSRRDTIKYKCNAQIQIVARFRAPFFRAPPLMGRKIPAAWSAAAGCFRRVDVGIDPYGAKWETGTFSPDTRGFSNTLCRGGRLCPPSKFVDFPWPFVGAAPTVENGKPTRFRRKTVIKRVLSAGRCRHRPLRRGMGNAAVFRLTHTILNGHL